ncbi:MAG: cell division protein ZapD [Thiohalophilus sp.]
MDNPIVYEQPLNERIRTYLRLEHLFRKAAYTLRGFSVWDSRATIDSLIDILEIVSRGELKAEILKELDRLYGALSRLKDMAGVDRDQLNTILSQLDATQKELHGLQGQPGQRVRDSELLSSLRQRSTITAGNCSFDMPGYHYWLQQDPEIRIAKLEEWYNELDAIHKPISLILGIIREASDARAVSAEKGFYQQSLDSQTPVQMLRVTVDGKLNCYPEISGGKHRFSIRFVQPGNSGRPVQVDDTVNFELTCCTL